MSALSSTPHQSSAFLSAHRCATVSLLRVTCLFYNHNDRTKAVPIHSFFFSHENNEQLLMFFLCGRSWLIVILFFLLLTGEIVFSSWLATCCISRFFSRLAVFLFLLLLKKKMKRSWRDTPSLLRAVWRAADVIGWWMTSGVERLASEGVSERLSEWVSG